MDGRGDSPYVTHFSGSLLLGETPDSLHGTPVVLNLLGTFETGAFLPHRRCQQSDLVDVICSRDQGSEEVSVHGASLNPAPPTDTF